MTDHDYMRRALALALRGTGRVNPNPLVGAVIVRDGRILAEGWHVAFGELHAERHALANCSEDPRGATIYVTLEPCCHHGKQPPCCDALIEAGISRVVVGSADPNPLVAGKGNARLREAGIQVDENVLREECDAINEPFFHFIETGRPLVIAKWAMSSDGRIAPKLGEQFWLTGESAHKRVHADRNRFAAIMVGANTVIADDPLLTCRLSENAHAAKDSETEAESTCGVPEGSNACAPGAASASASDSPASNPLRIIVDGCLRTPLTAQVVLTARETPTLIATAAHPNECKPYVSAGCEIMHLPADDEGRIALGALLDGLGARGIDSVIVEGGPTLHAELLSQGLIDRVQVYVAGRVIGGAEAPGPVGGTALAGALASLKLKRAGIAELGPDVLIEYEVK